MSDWQLDNIVSDNALVPSNNKQVLEPMLTKRITLYGVNMSQDICPMSDWQLDNIDSDNALVPSNNKQVLEPMLTKRITLYGVNMSQDICPLCKCKVSIVVKLNWSCTYGKCLILGRIILILCSAFICESLSVSCWGQSLLQKSSLDYRISR